MSSTTERKLAAIMFTDIVGYTAQMSKDEDKAFALIKKKRELLFPLLEKHEGKLIKEIGDGTLTRYFKADHAIDCATIFQGQTDEDLNIRAGIHMGEVIIDKEDVFGDVVNIAARLESFAAPGSVFVSKETIDKLELSDKVEVVCLGMQSLKGVGRLIEVYAIKHKDLIVPDPSDYTENKIEVHSDDEVPSIAIIPFENKGADEDVFYAYGISADLISDCSGAGFIRVAGLKDIEKHDYANLKYEELSEKLLVRYIAQGTLWKKGDMFQLSIELYDTKDKKVVWSDRWQEKWDNLPTIKGSLSDGLLKALDTKPKIEKKEDITNPTAYEFYLKAKHKYAKRDNTDDTEIARGLLDKAIELDDNLISAKVLLGTTYMHMGDYDEAMELYTPALKQAEELGDKNMMAANLCNIGIVHSDKGDYVTALDCYERSLAIRDELGDKNGMATNLSNIGIEHCNKGDYEKALDYYDRSLAIKENLGDKHGMGNSLSSIGIVHYYKGDYDKALDFYGRSVAIKEKLGDKSGIGSSLINIGIVHKNKGDYDKALDCYGRSLAIQEKLGDKREMGINLINIGIVHTEKGDYDKALDCYARSLAIQEKLGLKREMGINLYNIGDVHYNKGDLDKALDFCRRSLVIFEELGDKNGMAANLNSMGTVDTIKGEYGKAEEYLEKSLAIQKEIGVKVELETTTYLYLTYKYLSKDYDLNKIHNLIKEAENIEFDLNYALYVLIEDKSYLETAFDQVQENASAMDDGKKFLSYPIPKSIVEAWEKAK
tara:strand:+ start:67 stop:2379 length:2313 start_codon:yes stop_codon:yes gene_type:complete